MDLLEILERIRKKDAVAFDELMNRYGSKVYKRLLAQLGDRELADEAFKKTMLDFYDSMSRAEGEDEPPARTNDTARLHAQLDAELQAERRAASASSVTSSEKRA